MEFTLGLGIREASTLAPNGVAGETSLRPRCRSRMTTPAEVFNVTHVRLLIPIDISSQGGSSGETFQFGEELVGEGSFRVRRPTLNFRCRTLRTF